jgi:hypothetical protein
MERDTTQRLSVTRGSATVTYVVDYGESPPTVQAYMTAGGWSGHRDELIPRRFGTSIVWWMRERKGIVASGRAEWRSDLSHARHGSFDVCGEEGADLIAASEAARVEASKRWRVVRRRMAQAAVDGAALQAMVRETMTKEGGA